MSVEINGAKIFFTIPVLGGIPITETMVNAWLVMAIITGLCIWLTHGMTVRGTGKRQVVAELLVNTAQNFVDTNMGRKFSHYAPFIAALFSMSPVSYTHLEPMAENHTVLSGSVDKNVNLVNYQPGAKLQFGYGPGLKTLYIVQGAQIFLPVVAPSINADDTVNVTVSGAYYTDRTDGVELSYEEDQGGVWLYGEDGYGNLSGTGKCIIYLQFNGGGEAAMHVEVLPKGAAMPYANTAASPFSVPANGIFTAGSILNVPQDPSAYNISWGSAQWDIDAGRLQDGTPAFQVVNTAGNLTAEFYYGYISEPLQLAWASSVTLRKAPDVANITAFATRLYDKCLGRAPDDGIQTWINVLSDGSWTAERVAWGFIFSREYTNRKTSNADYVKMLYRVYMDREYDQSGFDMWVGLLNRGEWSREQVMEGFSRSKEFAGICARYGMTPW